MSTEASKAGSDKQIAERVEKAIEAARQGNPEPLLALSELGQAGVPYLAPYLDDADEDIRREVVTLLKTVAGKAALPLLVRALADANWDIRERAVRALYERYEPAELAEHQAAAGALRQSAARETPSAAALLLLANFPGPETEETLRTVRDRSPSVTVKLELGSPPVPASLFAKVALSRLGDQTSRSALMEAIDEATQDELELLLAILREIDAPEVLHSLKKTLADSRETRRGVPSGAEPKRRLCDLAVDAFVKRLKLRVSFAAAEGQRYSAEQIQEVQRKINSALPR